MPCTTADRQNFAAAREANQLTDDQMGPLVIFDNTRSLVIGILATRFIYDRIVPMVPETQTLPLTIIVVCVSIVLLALIDWALKSDVSFSDWRDNQMWGLLLMNLGNIVRVTCLYISAQLIFDLVVTEFQDAGFSFVNFLLMLAIMLMIFNFVLRMLRPTILV